jgi:hypothetical protein
MSLYVGDTTFDYGLKTSGLIDHNSAYTWMAWVDLVFDTNDYGHIWAALGDSSDTWQNADWLGTGSDGTSVRIGAASGGTSTSGSDNSFVVGTPKHVAVVRGSASSFQLFEDGTASSTANQDTSGRASTQREQIGTLNALRAPVRLTAIKQWQAALTADEIAAEMQSIRPIRLANLHSWHPAIANNLTDAFKDYSGNGRDWTSQGSNTVETQAAPVAWGGRSVLINQIIVTVQYARPTSDVTAGTWTASTGSDLYAMIDETVASDSDYIVTTGASTCEVALGSLSDPSSSTGHKVRYRLSATSGGITVRLRQGTTTIATWTHAPAPTSLTTYEQTLTGGEADSITNYAALKLQFEATA